MIANIDSGVSLSSRLTAHPGMIPKLVSIGDNGEAHIKFRLVSFVSSPVNALENHFTKQASQIIITVGIERVKLAGHLPPEGPTAER